jgi:hypothetical protein
MGSSEFDDLFLSETEARHSRITGIRGGLI